MDKDLTDKLAEKIRHTVNRGRLTDRQRIDRHMQTEKQNVEEEYLL